MLCSEMCNNEIANERSEIRFQEIDDLAVVVWFTFYSNCKIFMFMYTFSYEYNYRIFTN